MKIGVFCNVNNLYYYVNKTYAGRRLDYKKYLEIAVGENNLHIAIAYGTKQYNSGFTNCLVHYGYLIHYKNPKPFDARANCNVEMALDIARQIEKLDVVVLGSSDTDLLPLIHWIRDKGAKCIVMACNLNPIFKHAPCTCMEIDENMLEESKDEVGVLS